MIGYKGVRDLMKKSKSETYYMYYEEGRPQRISMRKAYRLYLTQVDQEQKRAGTTFDAWLYDMQRSGIFVKIGRDTSE